MASYPAYGSRTSPTVNAPYTSASPAAAGDGQFYPPGASRISLDDDERTSPFKYAKGGDAAVDMRATARTPSPTPSEAEELTKTSLFDWKAMSSWRYWIRKEWAYAVATPPSAWATCADAVLRCGLFAGPTRLRNRSEGHQGGAPHLASAMGRCVLRAKEWYYVIFTIALVATILFTVYHTQIVKWLQPAANWMHGLKFGWLIPIAILFVISFPPLFGHEIVAIICGLVWGLGIGFAIVCAGTFIGEIGNFYAFKYCCAARGHKLEQTDLRYACLARVVRQGGIKIALIARLSAIPGHFTTAVFSACGMSIWTFIVAAILSLPKQFITVYLGVALEQSDKSGSSTRDTIVKDVVVGITVIITFVAMWYIYNLMNKAKPEVIYERRKARQTKLMGLGSSPYSNSSMLQSTASVAFNPGAADESEIPLTARGETFGAAAYQQWDRSGRAVGYADPSLYVPEPRRAPVRPFAEASTHRPQGARTDSGASVGSAYQMSERGGYQSAPTRSDSGLTNPHPHPYAQAQAASRPASPPRYTNSPPPIAPPASAPLQAQATPQNSRPLQTAPAPGSQFPYNPHAMAAPAPMPNPYTAYAPSPPPTNVDPYAGYAPSPPPTNPFAPGYGTGSAPSTPQQHQFTGGYGSGSAPSTPPAHMQRQLTGGYPYGAQAHAQQMQMPGTAPLPPSYSSQTFGAQQQQQQQYPQTAAPTRGGYPTYEGSNQTGSSMPQGYSSDLR
ncbi:uncharacterized protein C8Q71DRAFT_881929 [Rhodofomes roseus]|uniref:Golgi apparatus membrane protein TVP38 n=1 Tax=Rhodofomes roseus TaxID=34475 RepID=A0ABQ8K3C0_9APHY|nr:uncharacterized protein C8Q71DRAFT_881929 [Rhodofomes roseus]KAH9831331.1 hypothetical protein C8Q71DRAFT_881929 [Rhodofomes roseus]